MEFLKFFPGFVGGHCIGVDPYYLIHKAKELDIEPKVVNSCRETNEKMASHIARKIIKQIYTFKSHTDTVNILVKGITFKENVKDVRNSKIIHLIQTLENFGFHVVTEDPYAEKEDVQRIYNRTLTRQKEINSKFDAVIMAVDHDAYHLENITNYLSNPENSFVFDIRGTHKNLQTVCNYHTI